LPEKVDFDCALLLCRRCVFVQSSERGEYGNFDIAEMGRGGGVVEIKAHQYNFF
jgi:hypothetical protein